MIEALFEIIVRPILEGIFEIVCYFTVAPLLPAISFGDMRAEKFGVDEGPFAWHGFKRLKDRTIVVQAQMVSLIGLAMWLAVGTLAVLYWSFG